MCLTQPQEPIFPTPEQELIIRLRPDQPHLLLLEQGLQHPVVILPPEPGLLLPEGILSLLPELPPEPGLLLPEGILSLLPELPQKPGLLLREEHHLPGRQPEPELRHREEPVLHPFIWSVTLLMPVSEGLAAAVTNVQ